MNIPKLNSKVKVSRGTVNIPPTLAVMGVEVNGDYITITRTYVLQLADFDS